MSWRKLRGVHLPYEKQVYIRATCLLWQEQPKRIREKIQRLCEECGGAYAAALWDMMCTKKSVTQITMSTLSAKARCIGRGSTFTTAGNLQLTGRGTGVE